MSRQLGEEEIDSQLEKITILRITEQGRSSAETAVTKEFPLTIVLNNQELVTLLCSPKDLKYLAVGFLFSEGLVKNKEEIKKLIIDEQRGVVRIETTQNRESSQDVLFKRLITSGCGRGTYFYYADVDITGHRIRSEMKISATEVFALVNAFQNTSAVYVATHGVHSATLCDQRNILVFADDIGRQNAIDKVFGKCILEDIPTTDRAIMTSGRISSEILYKAARRNVPIILSISVPTDLAVRIANDLGITLIGFVKGKKMNVYSNDWRVS